MRHPLLGRMLYKLRKRCRGAWASGIYPRCYHGYKLTPEGCKFCLVEARMLAAKRSVE